MSHSNRQKLPKHPQEHETNASAPPPPYYQNSIIHHQSPEPEHADSSDDDDDEHGHEGEMHKHCELARKELLRYGFPPTLKVKICIGLDVSVSMENPNEFYLSKKIDNVINKAMSLAIELSNQQNHSVTVFPFGKEAFDPIEINEHNLKSAVATIMRNIGGKLSPGTNYNLVLEKIRKKYFGSSARASAPIPSDEAPVLCFFLTDGEPQDQIDEARNQFRYSQYNAIFFKFIALKGKQQDLQFTVLKTICSKEEATFVPNKHLLSLKDPDELTIKNLFFGFRNWLIEAHEHQILINNPNIDLSIENPDDREELEAQQELEKDHGHATNRYRQFKAAPKVNTPLMPSNQNDSESSLCKGMCSIL